MTLAARYVSSTVSTTDTFPFPTCDSLPNPGLCDYEEEILAVAVKISDANTFRAVELILLLIQDVKSSAFEKVEAECGAAIRRKDRQVAEASTQLGQKTPPTTGQATAQSKAQACKPFKPTPAKVRAAASPALIDAKTTPRCFPVASQRQATSPMPTHMPICSPPQSMISCGKVEKVERFASTTSADSGLGLQRPHPSPKDQADAPHQVEKDIQPDCSVPPWLQKVPADATKAVVAGVAVPPVSAGQGGFSAISGCSTFPSPASDLAMAWPEAELPLWLQPVARVKPSPATAGSSISQASLPVPAEFGADGSCRQELDLPLWLQISQSMPTRPISG